MGKKHKDRGSSENELSSLARKKCRHLDPLSMKETAVNVLEVISMRPAIFEDVQMKGFRQAVWPLMERQRHQHFEPRLDKPSLDPREIMCAENINGTIALAEYCNRNVEEFESPDMKVFRRALHPLVLHFFRKDKGRGLGDNGEPEIKKGNLLSALFQAKKYKEALEHIRSWTESIARGTGEKEEQEEIKLGSMQRWVRHASIEKSDWDDEDHEGEEIGRMSTLLLDALLRLVAAYRGSGGSEGNESKDGSDRTSSGEITFHEPFVVGSSVMSAAEANAQAAATTDTKVVWTIVHTQKGADRRPPTQQDLHYYYPAANCIRYDASSLSPKRYDIPFLPGAFVLSDVLTAAECSQLLALSSQIGFVPDAVDGIDNFNMLAHASILDPVYERCRPLLPQHLNVKGRKRTLAGINARLRFFRYAADSVYRPHIDGGWPGSGLKDDTGEFTDDYFGDRHSQFTFLVYLNDDFDGGNTTFYSPKEGSGLLQWGGIDARRVQPRMGCVLVFPHGTFEAPVHEGSATTRGQKFVIRTDVLYSL